ncbi:MAG: hypothetical protein AAGH92_07375 [Planctomycetota bacterium]
MCEDGKKRSWIDSEAFKQLQELSSAQQTLESRYRLRKRDYFWMCAILSVGASCLGIAGWRAMSASINNEITKKVPERVATELDKTEAAKAADSIIEMREKAENILVRLEEIDGELNWVRVTTGPFKPSHQYVIIIGDEVFYASRVTPTQLHFSWDTRKNFLVQSSPTNDSISVEQHIYGESEKSPINGWLLYSQPTGIPGFQL